MAREDTEALIELYRRELVELSLEYIGYAHRLDDLDDHEKRRMHQIERRVYELYETLDDEIVEAVATHISVFANLVYQYRIFPLTLDTMH